MTDRFTSALLAGKPDRAVEVGREFVALAHEMHDAGADIEATWSLGQAYEMAGDGRNIVDTYQSLLDLLDKQPDGGAPEMRGMAKEGIGRGWQLLGKPERALAPLRDAVAIDVHGGKPLEVQWESAAVALGDALLDTDHPHEARVLIEPVLRALIDDPSSLPQRRGGAEFVLARALWRDGGRAERERARAIADDSLKDYQAAIARLKAPGGLPIAVPRLEAKAAAVVAWRARPR
jgi:tetratricopeptide (TPR) repeat protein